MPNACRAAAVGGHDAGVPGPAWRRARGQATRSAPEAAAGSRARRHIARSAPATASDRRRVRQPQAVRPGGRRPAATPHDGGRRRRANPPPRPPVEDDAPPAEAFFALIESRDDPGAGPPLIKRRRTRWAARLTYLGLLAAPVVFSMIILNRKTSWFTVEERMRYDGSGTYPRNIYTPKHISHWYFVALGGAFIWIMLTLLCVLQLEPGPGEKVDEGEDAAWVPARDVKKIAPLPYESDMSCDESALSGDDASHRKSSEWDKRHRRRIAGTAARRRGPETSPNGRSATTMRMSVAPGPAVAVRAPVGPVALQLRREAVVRRRVDRRVVRLGVQEPRGREGRVRLEQVNARRAAARVEPYFAVDLGVRDDAHALPIKFLHGVARQEPAVHEPRAVEGRAFSVPGERVDARVRREDPFRGTPAPEEEDGVGRVARGVDVARLQFRGMTYR